MTTKLELTKIFLEQSGTVSSPEEVIIKTYLNEWWVTPFSPIGFRLTAKGNKFLSSVLKLESYTFKIKEDNTKSLKLFLQMNRHLTSPFYLQGLDTIIMYGETDAIMMGLYAGDLALYLGNFSR